MNTAWLAQQVLPRWGLGDVAALGASDALILLRAINGGLQEAATLLPSVYSQVPVTVALPAPMAVSVTVTQGSADISEQAGFAGRGITIAGDAQFNRLAEDTKLRFPYNGPTGTHAAVIYSDAWRMESPVARMVAPPTISSPFPLPPLMPAPPDAMASLEVGTPVHYWIEPAGATQGAEPPFWMRIAPAPATPVRLSFTADVRPPRLTLQSLVMAGQIAFHSHFIEKGLLPLIEEEMAAHTLWADPKTKADAAERAKAAREFLRNQPASLDTNFNRVFTPPGY
ncbi:MAG: hypothetical protein IAE97_00170 [Chthoniobacterales bacterium]|nr:hypothetical protein [Chthoniobacterales bacterium]